MKIQLRENLKQIKHYQNHPQMRPFIGEDYGKIYKKLLIVAESHYISDSDENSNLRDPQEYENTIKNWYDLKESDLKKYDIEWTHTSNIITYSNLINDNNPSCHKIFSNINSAIQNNSLTKLGKNERMFNHIVYMNFFQ